jgi:arginine:pyruvate transaminase
MMAMAKPPARPRDSGSLLPYSELVERIGGESARTWEVHSRARKLEDQGHDIILLSVGDPDFDTPPAIVDAAVDSLRRGRTHYTSMVGIPALREAIVRRHKALTGHDADPDAVVVMSGAQCALFATMMCLVQAGDEVIVPEPAYVTYDGVIGASGATTVQVPLRGERGFHLDPADVAAAITPRTRAMLINFPHNPTGATITAEELDGVAALCRRHDLWLVSDEVYATLTYEGPHRSPVSLPGMAERTVVIDSLSKSHAMTGWRLGWAVAPGNLAHHLEHLALCMLYGCPPFVQDAAVVALGRDFAEIDAMRAAFRARRDHVAARINAMPRARCIVPEGSMFMMIDVRETGLGSVDFAMRLLEAGGVSLLPAEGFGPSAKGYLRMSLSAPVEVLDDACDRLERFLRGLNC